MPFIIRGVKLWGMIRLDHQLKRREFVWDEAAKLNRFFQSKIFY